MLRFCPAPMPARWPASERQALVDHRLPETLQRGAQNRRASRVHPLHARRDSAGPTRGGRTESRELRRDSRGGLTDERSGIDSTDDRLHRKIPMDPRVGRGVLELLVGRSRSRLLDWTRGTLWMYRPLEFAAEFLAKPWRWELRFAQIGETAPSVIGPLAFAVGAN